MILVNLVTLVTSIGFKLKMAVSKDCHSVLINFYLFDCLEQGGRTHVIGYLKFFRFFDCLKSTSHVNEVIISSSSQD